MFLGFHVLKSSEILVYETNYGKHQPIFRASSLKLQIMFCGSLISSNKSKNTDKNPEIKKSFKFFLLETTILYIVMKAKIFHVSFKTILLEISRSENLIAANTRNLCLK